MRTDKSPGELSFEAVLTQLRLAYKLLEQDGDWGALQRRRFVEGLIGPQIEKLEILASDFNQARDDLASAFAANARHRRHLREAKEKLLANAGNIASASQARRIIITIFEEVERG